MAYITLSNTNKIIFNSDLSKFELSGQLYKIPIYFFSKYEENALLAIQELLKDPQNYFNEIYVPFKPIDSFSYVYEGKYPSYHDISSCPRLNSKYDNFKIPDDIKEKGNEKVQEFRSWFETVKHLLEKPEIFVALLQVRWGIITNSNAISIDNSGSTAIEELTIEELEKSIDGKLKDAGFFYYQNDKNKIILQQFSKFTYIAYKPDAIYNNNTKYSDTEIKELLKHYYEEFKKPLKKMLIEYYRLKHNPDIKMEGQVLEQIGFKPCGNCYKKRINIEDLF